MSRHMTYFGLTCALGILSVIDVSAGKPVDEGRQLAIEACSACHQVIPGQKRPAPVAEGEEGTHVEAPTFAEIAGRCLSSSELRGKIANPHYPMREQVLMPVDLDGLTLYIQSLSPRPNCAIR